MKSCYPVALDLEGHRAVVIGGGHGVAGRCERLAAAGASVVVVASEAERAIHELAARSRVRWYARGFVSDDVRGARLVLLTDRNQELARTMRARARRDGYLFCAVDDGARSDFMNMGVVSAGPVQVALSASGSAPLLVRRLRVELERLLDVRFASFAERFARYRAAVAALPWDERQAKLSRAVEGFAISGTVRYPDWEREPEGEP